MNKYWKDNDNFKVDKYKAVLEEIADVIKNENFADYEIAVLQNTSGADLISSDNPMCMIDLNYNRLIEGGALKNSTVFLFPFGFDKVILIFKTNEYRIVKHKLNLENILQVNKLIAINSDKQLIVSSSFKEKQIIHWLSILDNTCTDKKTIINRVLTVGEHSLFEFSPAFSKLDFKLKFIEKIT